MKVNQKKANRIIGLFATLNKIEEKIAKDKFAEAEGRSYSQSFVSFDCNIYIG